MKMRMSHAYRKHLVLIALGTFAVGGFFLAAHSPQTLHAKDKDKVPPVISDLFADSITQTSANIHWTTDEPANSAIRYDVAPRANKKGPSDDSLVLTHTVILSDLTDQTTYAYCAESRDEANNKSEACGTFITASATSTPPAPPNKSKGGAAPVPSGTYIISGFAYPSARIEATITSVFPTQKTQTQVAEAASTGAFTLSFTFPKGLYVFNVSAVDMRGASSTRKGFQFELQQGNIIVAREGIMLPPSISIERGVVTQGDTVVVSGSTIPLAGVLVQVDDMSYETRSDEHGIYRALISTATLKPGSHLVRARSTVVSISGYDYSLTKAIVVTTNSVPEADLNADGMVTIKDLSMFLVHPTDLNKDGKISAADLSIFLRAFK